MKHNRLRRCACWIAIVGLLAGPIPNAGALESITVIGLFTGKAMLDLDGKQRLLRVGESSPEGLKLIEVTGEHAVVEIGGVKRTLKLGNRNYSTPTEATVQIWPTDNLYRVQGTINNKTVDFVVDTGATLVSINNVDAKRLGLDYLKEGKPAESSTASGIAKVYIMELKQVRVGSIELKDVRAAVYEDKFPEIALLGMSFLGRLNIKREGDVMELKRKF